jgi:phosphoglycolate phosphatase
VAVVVFDFDGVLVDSFVPVTASINAALREHGFAQRPPAELRWLIGPPTYWSFARLTGAPIDSREVAAIVATYRGHYEAAYLTQTTVFPGVVEMLEALGARFALAIATSKSSDFAAPLLEELGLARFFSAVAAADPRATEEDKRAVVGQALAALGESSGAMVGDREFDMAAGLAWGLRPVGVSWGIGSVEELHAAGAEAIAATPAELAALLLGAAG